MLIKISYMDEVASESLIKFYKAYQSLKRRERDSIFFSQFSIIFLTMEV